MKQRYNELTRELCVRAVLEAFQDKWLRRDVVQLANKYGGISYGQLKQGKEAADLRPVLEAAEGIALELEELIFELLDGDEDALDLEPGKETRFLSVEEEHRRKKASSPAERGCPSLDMGGFRMHRTYTTVRKCIYLRARRSYLRAGKDARRMGWMDIRRACRIGAYYGYYKNTASRMARDRLDVDKLTFLAGVTVSRNSKRRFCNAA